MGLRVPSMVIKILHTAMPLMLTNGTMTAIATDPIKMMFTDGGCVTTGFEATQGHCIAVVIGRRPKVWSIAVIIVGRCKAHRIRRLAETRTRGTI